MKSYWQLLAGLAIGLAIGLAWKPYSITTQRLGDASAIVRVNRFTGSSKILGHGDNRWQNIRDDTETTAIPDWAR